MSPFVRRCCRGAAALLSGLVVALCWGGVPSAGATVLSEGSGAGGIRPDTVFTPLTGIVPSPPTPVEASDGKVHLAYELLITNVTTFELQVASVGVRNARTGRVLDTLTGARLAADLRPLGSAAQEQSPDPSELLASSATAIVWLDVTVAARTEVPKVLDHRVVAKVISPTGGPSSFNVVIARTRVRPGAAIVLGPPVAAGTWLESEGCCSDYTHHRRGLAPVNGDLMVPQRFAIDFFKMNNAHQTWTGDPTKVASYLSYGQPVIAAAKGVVVASRDNLPDQHPPQPPRLPPIADTVGNHVIVKIRPGVYLLYGHLKPGSVRVKKGAKVKLGERLGLIGTSGNSTTPHLHFQVITTPTFFPTDSTPFVFTHFDRVGRVTERLWDDNLGLAATGTLPYAAAPGRTARTNEMPLDREVDVFRGTSR
jgi:Peptidase family M23